MTFISCVDDPESGKTVGIRKLEAWGCIPDTLRDGGGTTDRHKRKKKPQVDLCHSLGSTSVGSSNLYSQQPLRRCLFTAQIDNYSLWGLWAKDRRLCFVHYKLFTKAGKMIANIDRKIIKYVFKLKCVFNT